MVNMELFTFLSADGVTTLHGVEWRDDAQAPVAVLQIAHGMAEYIRRYDGFARFLAQHGFVVAGHDHLGHGESLPRGGTPVYFSPTQGWERAVEDIYSLHRRLKERYPHLPCYLLGHSMGSFLSRTFLIQHSGCVDGAIVMGTGWQNTPKLQAGLTVSGLLCRIRGGRVTSKLMTAQTYGAYNRAVAPNRTAFDWIAANEAAVDRYIADPMCGHPPSVGLLHDLLRGIRFNQQAENLRRMTPHTPVLFISGADDPVGDMGRGVEKSAASFRNAGMEDVTVLLCPGLRHEVLNESTAPEAVNLPILRWLEAHL